jgi:hypothetical protein
LYDLRPEIASQMRLVPVILIVSILACSKKEPVDPYPSLEAKAIVNGTDWDSKSWFTCDPNNANSFLINIIGYDISGVQREHLSFIGAPEVVGRYTLYLMKKISLYLHLICLHQMEMYPWLIMQLLQIKKTMSA